jgi:hypothetical protein
VGRLKEATIIWVQSVRYGTGTQPDVAVNNKNVVVEVHKSRSHWLGDPLHYDDGMPSSVAEASKMIVAVHEGSGLSTLWFSTSLFTNGASWMQDRLATLGDTRLGDLVLPATHDSGMYLSGINAVGKTQQLSLYGRATSGTRQDVQRRRRG